MICINIEDKTGQLLYGPDVRARGCGITARQTCKHSHTLWYFTRHLIFHVLVPCPRSPDQRHLSVCGWPHWSVWCNPWRSPTCTPKFDVLHCIRYVDAAFNFCSMCFCKFIDPNKLDHLGQGQVWAGQYFPVQVSGRASLHNSWLDFFYKPRAVSDGIRSCNTLPHLHIASLDCILTDLINPNETTILTGVFTSPILTGSITYFQSMAHMTCLWTRFPPWDYISS